MRWQSTGEKAERVIADTIRIMKSSGGVNFTLRKLLRFASSQSSVPF